MKNVKISYLIENVDKSISNESEINWSKLGGYFDLYELNWSDDTRLKAYYLKKTKCTDQYVGTRLYFLDGIFVAMSKQIARRYPEEFAFESHEAATKLREYLLSLLDEEEYTYDLIEDLEEEFSPLFSVTFNSQICNTHAWYQNEQVKVIKSDFGWHDNYSVLIELADGTQTIVNVSELEFEYFLKKD